QAFEADDSAGRRKPDLRDEDEGDGGSMLGDTGARAAARPPRERPRPSRTPRRPAMTADQVLARSGLPQAKALMSRPAGSPPADPQAQMQALASVLLACAREPAKPENAKPSRTATVLAALQAHLASQG